MANKKNDELRGEFESLIWTTIVKKSWIGLLVLLGSIIIIPLFSKMFSSIMLHLFKITF